MGPTIRYSPVNKRRTHDAADENAQNSFKPHDSAVTQQQPSPRRVANAAALCEYPHSRDDKPVGGLVWYMLGKPGRPVPTHGELLEQVALMRRRRKEKERREAAEAVAGLGLDAKDVRRMERWSRDVGKHQCGDMGCDTQAAKAVVEVHDTSRHEARVERSLARRLTRRLTTYPDGKRSLEEFDIAGECRKCAATVEGAEKAEVAGEKEEERKKKAVEEEERKKAAAEEEDTKAAAKEEEKKAHTLGSANAKPATPGVVEEDNKAAENEDQKQGEERKGNESQSIRLSKAEKRARAKAAKADAAKQKQSAKEQQQGETRQNKEQDEQKKSDDDDVGSMTMNLGSMFQEEGAKDSNKPIDEGAGKVDRKMVKSMPGTFVSETKSQSGSTAGGKKEMQGKNEHAGIFKEDPKGLVVSSPEDVEW